jgi:hypothetical protein
MDKTVKVFDTQNMLVMLTGQQPEPFKPGQRISADIAALLNGFGDVLEALDFYQASTDAGEPNAFVAGAEAVPAPIVDPVAADIAAHTVPQDKSAKLISAFRVPKGGQPVKADDLEF